MIDTYENRLKVWAARKLELPVAEIDSVKFQSWELCETCEYSWGEIFVTLANGKVYETGDNFGLALTDIIDLELDENGELKDAWGYNDLEELELNEYNI